MSDNLDQTSRVRGKLEAQIDTLKNLKSQVRESIQEKELERDVVIRNA